MATAATALVEEREYLIMRSGPDGEVFLTSTGWSPSVARATRFAPVTAVNTIRTIGGDAMIVDISVFMPIRRRQAGFALILEMLVVCAVLLVIAAFAIPSIVQIRAAANQNDARSTVMQVWNAQAAATICSNTPGCIPSSSLTALIPQPGTVRSSGYTFTYIVNGTTWAYSATPTQPGLSGHHSYIASQTGFVCTDGGAPCN
jgi:type II secretory pathway pseudopilin PulG